MTVRDMGQPLHKERGCPPQSVSMSQNGHTCSVTVEKWSQGSGHSPSGALPLPPPAPRATQKIEQARGSEQAAPITVASLRLDVRLGCPSTYGTQLLGCLLRTTTGPPTPAVLFQGPGQSGEAASPLAAPQS